jgi:tripartite motif-containing protein 2/3/tripartite motif-containing protein 71
MEHLFEIRAMIDNSGTKCGKCENEKAVSFCRDCKEFVCQSCGDWHQRWKELKLHDISPLDQLQDGPAKADLVTLLASKQKSEIAQHILPLQEQLVTIGKALESLNTEEKAICEQQETVVAEVSKEFDDICRHLNQRKVQLRVEIDGSVRDKVRKLAVQKKKIQQVYTSTASCLKFAIGSLHINEELGRSAMERIEKVRAQCEATILPPVEAADMKVVFPDKADLLTMCSTFGNLPDNLLSAEKTIVSGDGLEYLDVEESKAILVHARDIYNGEYKKPYELVARLTHTPTNTNIECIVDQQSPSQCNVLYEPTQWGKHELYLSINKKEIKGSPFTVRVLPTVKCLAKPSKVIAGLKKPQGVTTNSKGHILVTEEGAHCVSVFNGGEKLFLFGTNGNSNQQFDHPHGIAVDENDNIYVADSANHRIQKFTAKGNFIGVVGSNGERALCFKNPRDISHNKKDNRLYVCDDDNHRIQVLETNLTFCRAFGETGSGNGQLSYPYGIGFNDDGTVVVAEYHNNKRVQIFTPEGTHIHVLQGKTLNNPCGIAIDSAGSIYVSERDGNCISIFDKCGKLVTSFGTGGAQPGQFNKPNLIHIDRYDNLYVADTGNGRLQIF